MKIKKNCLFCGKEFMYKDCRSNTLKKAGKYCSNSCSIKARNRNAYLNLLKENSIFKEDKTKRLCTKCKGYKTLNNFHYLIKKLNKINPQCNKCLKARKQKLAEKGISSKSRFDILKRHSFTCQYCGNKAPNVQITIDHIIPVSKGGSHSVENLTVACFECNRGKSNNIL